MVEEKTKTIVITSDDENQRLDSYLAINHPEYSRSIWQKLVKTGHVKVNGAPQPPKYQLKVGNRITIETFKPAKTENLPVIYEDDDVLIVNKPAGVLSHLKSDLESEPSVASFIASKTTAEGGNRAGIVHRLDRATSGVMITALTEEARVFLSKQFSNRHVQKWYVAVVKGEVNEPQLLDSAIRRSHRNPTQFITSEDGKEAKTYVYPIIAKQSKSVVLLKPVTGRTHQLRVHLKSIEHPIIGDKIYTKTSQENLMLHAYQLEITIPSGDRKTFIAPIPESMSDYINNEDVDKAITIAKQS